MYDSTYMNCLEQANLQRQKGNEWLPGPGEREMGVTVNEDGVSFWGGGNVLELVVVVAHSINILKTTELYTLKG